MPFRDIINIYKNSPIDKSRFKLMYDPDTQKVKLDEKKPINTTVIYRKDETHFNKRLLEYLFLHQFLQ